MHTQGCADSHSYPLKSSSYQGFSVTFTLDSAPDETVKKPLAESEEKTLVYKYLQGAARFARLPRVSC